MKIIFMGTSNFAELILKQIINHNNSKIVAVFTAAPKARGRGMKQESSPVAKLASKHGIITYEPKTLRTDEVYEIINNIDADVIIVASYGLIIPSNILWLKKYGCLNVHPSILPKYRGPAPMQWSLINGDTETGVCIMQMDIGVDTGDILLQTKFPLVKSIDYPILHDYCANLGGELIIKILENIDNLTPTKQPIEGVFHARKLTKEDGLISWYDSPEVINNKIRGMNPWPGVYFKYLGKNIKILLAECSYEKHNIQPGTIIDENFTIACHNGIVKIKMLQLEGKNIISIKEFLNGKNISKNTILD